MAKRSSFLPKANIGGKNMSWKKLPLALICFVGACKDNPYREPVEPERASYSFNGVVELGTPVTGATVAAHKFSELKRGEKIGEAVSNRDGSFDLNLQTDYQGPLLLVASGGLFRDLATGETTALKPSQELQSAITHINMPERTNINAWTTMAVARVLAEQGYWDKSVAALKDIDRINVDFSHVSYFLAGESTKFINIRRQDFFDVEKDSLDFDDPKVTLHLAHGGLSQLAKDFSARLKDDGIVISVPDLLTALVDDLSDRIFDGRNARGSVVFIGNNHRVNLSSYTMRKNLSEAIMLYLKRLQGAGKISDEQRRSVEQPGKMVDSLARDSRPELFPSAEQPLSVDHEPPSISIQFAGTHRGERQFAILSGDVNFDVEAHDDSGVQEVRLIEPNLANAPGQKFGPVTEDFIPQAAKAAHVCGKTDVLREVIQKRELALENIICACFEVIDIFENSAKELSCFQRATPKAQIEFPTSNSVLSSKSLSEGVKLKAIITSGMPINACSWSIEQSKDLPSGNGAIDGNRCVIDEVIDGAHFVDGNYSVVVNAQDIGGRTIKSKIEFQVVKEPPVVEIISPSSNGFVNSSALSVAGKITNARLIHEIVVSFHGTGEANHEFIVSTKAAVHVERNEWTVTLSDHLPPGPYAFDVLVKDIYGNEKTMPARELVIDNEPPTILGALDGVTQDSYIQETVNFRQRIVDTETTPHYVIEPVGEATPLDWEARPVIHRWHARVNDEATAPRYVFKAMDDNSLKQVRYGIDTTCVDADNASKITVAENDHYEIRFIQSAANVDLTMPWQKLCLSIWAFDEAGNIASHVVEFSWKPVASPLALDMNAARYKAHHREDDISWVGPPVWKLFRGNDPIALKKDLVIGHLIIANLFPTPASIKLKLDKSLMLKIGANGYTVDSRIVDIKYYAYDLAVNEIGVEKTLSDGTAIINGSETIVAKFILAKELPLLNIRHPDDNFWQRFSLELGFSKSGSANPFVDGLSVIIRDPGVGTILNEQAVPWGDNHDIRRRIAPRQGR